MTEYDQYDPEGPGYQAEWMPPSNPASNRNEAAERLRYMLRKGMGWPDEHLSLLDAALATERAIGAALDVERLQQAIDYADERANDRKIASHWLDDVVAEYARLTPQPGEPTDE